MSKIKRSHQQWLRKHINRYLGNLWWLLGLIRSWNRLVPCSVITVDRHQGRTIDRLSFISSTASSREAHVPLSRKTGKASDIGFLFTSNWFHCKANSKLYLVSKNDLNRIVERSPSIAKHMSHLCSSAPQKSPKSPKFSKTYLNLKNSKTYSKPI